MSAASKDDKELIRMCLKGQERGYALLYEKYAVSVFNTICRLVNFEMVEAEDLLQEAFVAVFSDMERVREVENFGAWMRRVAINQSISHLRKRRVYFEEITDRVEAQAAEDDEAEEQWKEDRLQDLSKAIQELPEVGRMIVNLFVFEEMPQEEIARVLGMSHVAVRSQYHRAKIKLAAQLKNELLKDERAG